MNYTIPGGGIEFAESAKEALNREIGEEIGGNFSLHRYCFLGCFEQHFHHIRLGQLHDLSLYFLLNITTAEKNYLYSKEDGYVCYWANISDIAHLNIVPPQLDSMIKAWLPKDYQEAFKSGFAKLE